MPAPVIRIFRLILFLLVLQAVMPPDAEAQRRRRGKEPDPQAQLVERLRQHVGILAHDSLEGRRTGTEGEAKAVRYIEEQYRLMNIAPAGTDGFRQPFVIDEGKRYASGSRVSIDGQGLKPGDDFFPMAWSAAGSFSTDASLSLHEPGEAWWIDLRDTLTAHAGNPHFMLGAHLADVSKSVAAKGATALILYNSGDRSDSLAFVARDRTEAAPIPVLYITQSAVKRLSLTAESAPQVAATIAFEPVQRQGTNVVARIDNGARLTVAIGAHFDHLGYGEDQNSRHTGEPDIHNGADDNASGTAAVIEIARLLSDNGPRDYNYLFLHFSGEELGLYGSKYFTEHPTEDLSRISYMINLDMVGRLSDSSKALTVGGIGTSPAWAELLKPAADFGFRFDSSGTGPSDHTSFYRKQIPVLFFFTGLHTDYHRPGDDAEKINYTGQARIVQYITALIGRSAGAEKLAFTPTREQTMGQRGFRVSIGIMPDYTYSGAGVKLDGVIEGRPAQKAGLQAGDVLLQLGDVLITGIDMYMQALNRFDKGQTTTVTYRRGNEIREAGITF